MPLITKEEINEILLNKKEFFDKNKKFEVHLNPQENVDNSNRSFFSDNKNINIISNFGQIFDLIKMDEETKKEKMKMISLKKKIKYYIWEQMMIPSI